MTRLGSPPLRHILSRLAASRSDTDAWKSLYLRMWPFVFGTNFRLLGGARHAAEDASQEVFLRLLQYSKFQNLQEPDSFYRYLRTVCTNVTRDYLHRLSERKETGFVEEEVELLRSRLPKAGQELITEEYAQILSGLEATDREMIEMAIRGYSLDEIADAAGLTYQNAGVRLHRIRRNLREAWFKLGGRRK